MENKKYNEYYYGKKVSQYGLDNGYVDYGTLSNVVGDCVLCNAMEKRLYITMDIASDKEMYDIFQWYIISYGGAQFLMHNTDETVFYDNELDVYVWGITHWGTGLDYVLTNIKLKEKD